jgi:hypothetical protein
MSTLKTDKELAFLHDLFIAPDGEEFASIATGPAGNGGADIKRRVSRK